jgi:tRNA modification GTPase
VEHQSSHRGREPREALADTIVAAATAPGRGGIAIVRISGPDTERIARQILRLLPDARVATGGPFYDADGLPIDDGLACYFPAPHSYTGESVLELHCHGSPVVVEALIRRVLQLGARRAGPGEFTQRAYLNAKLDLAQAEAVADLIDAASESAARAALRSLQGEFSRRVIELSDQLGELRTQVEAAIDFADEQLDVLSDRALKQRLNTAIDGLHQLQAAGRQGRVLTQGITVVIAGRPNAGKSTLLNRLAGHDAAIVTATPGTTRDVLRERITLDGLVLTVLDTAGLRAPNDAIEAEGIRRARAAMAGADRILFVIDAAADPKACGYLQERAALPAQVPVTVVFNKLDLSSRPAALAAPGDIGAAVSPDVIALSALTGQGLDTLVSHLKEAAGVTSGTDAPSARARHLEALSAVDAFLAEAAKLLSGGGAPELVAEELKRAQLSLGEIVGVESSDELLGRIFSSFCIGK